jgi:Flp pilus assembly protein TadB
MRKLIENIESQTTWKPEKTLSVLNEERQCDTFVQWQQGFTPKEHRDMLDRMLVLEREERRDRELRDWQERQEAKAEERHKEQLGETRRMHRRELLVLGVGVTVAIIIITLVGAAIETSWIPTWFGLVD